MSGQRGFTLIEAIVALGIAATALVVLIGRLGASADVQRTLSLHTLAWDEATSLLARQMLEKKTGGEERSGTVEAAGQVMHWRAWTEKTMLDGFVRRNVSVRVDGEPEVVVFLYQEAGP